MTSQWDMAGCMAISLLTAKAGMTTAGTWGTRVWLAECECGFTCSKYSHMVVAGCLPDLPWILSLMHGHTNRPMEYLSPASVYVHHCCASTPPPPGACPELKYTGLSCNRVIQHWHFRNSDKQRLQCSSILMVAAFCRHWVQTSALEPTLRLICKWHPHAVEVALQPTLHTPPCHAQTGCC